jgi:transcriptional regulator with XRE-family HTH domain
VDVKSQIKGQMKSVFRKEYDIFRCCMIEARKTAGLTQETLAKSLNKPQSFVAKYENGERRLDVIEFILITRVIGVDTGQIIRKVAQSIAEISHEDQL